MPCPRTGRWTRRQWLRSSVFAQNFSEHFLHGPVLDGVFAFPAGSVAEPFLELPAAQGIEAMQALNRTAVAPFMLVGFGTAVLCIVVIVQGVSMRHTARGRWMLGGAVVYVIAAIMITFAANVPISYTIDTRNPSSPDAAARWADLYTQWVWWDHLRALGSIGAAVSLAIGATSATVSPESHCPVRRQPYAGFDL